MVQQLSAGKMIASSRTRSTFIRQESGDDPNVVAIRSKPSMNLSLSTDLPIHQLSVQAFTYRVDSCASCYGKTHGLH